MSEITVLDAAGNIRSLDWLRSKYGPFVIYHPPAAEETALTWRITALREKVNAPAALVVKTLGIDQAPAPGIQVAWYWPDAPADADAGPAGAPFEGVTPGRCVSGYANADGDTGFAMGDGAYYHAELGIRGPHAVWVHGAKTRSDLILGLGMLPLTNHDHFDVEFTLVDDGGEEPGPIIEPTILYWLAEIVEQLIRIADALQDPGFPIPPNIAKELTNGQ